MWNSITPATLWPLATALFAILSYYFVPGAYKDTGIESAWQAIERKARAATAAPLEADLPRGWIRRSVLGVAFYYDILTDRWTWRRPEKRPLYAKVVNSGLPDLRLITIVPSAYDDPLECLLFTLPFSTWAGVTDAPFRWLWPRSTADLIKLFSQDTLQVFHKRTAVGDILTWCWGDPKITETITVNGHALEVTTNLVAALRRLRAAGPVTLWVDAICINQRDNAEKQAMLGLMRMLYMSAKTVHCWLGTTEDVHRDRFFDIITNIERGNRALLSPEVILEVHDGTYTTEDMRCDRQCLEAVSALPYWSRKWVIQEIVLAARLNLHCGGRSLVMEDPSLLARAMQRLYYHVSTASISTWAHVQFRELFQDPVPDMTITFKGLTAGATLRTMKDHKELPSLLQDLRESSVTKSKDAIFGILALLEPFDIKPDINASTNSIFLLATTRIMTVTQSLDLLEQARFDSLPSWIPDYSQPHSNDRSQDHGPLGTIAKPYFSICGTSLKTAAFELGVIAAVCRAELHPADRSSGTFLPHFSLDWTRKRYAVWKAFFDEHNADPLHQFQWSFLRQDVASRSTDGGTLVSSDVTLEALAEIQDAVESFMAGDDTAHRGDWARYINTKTIFVTTDGRFGMTFSDADIVAGDLIVAFASALVPFCVRPVTQRPTCNCRKMDVVERLCECNASSESCEEESRFAMGARQGTLQGTCYLQDTWNETPMRAVAKERFGDESRIDDVFEPFILW